MDVISIISDGFNVYFPIAILAFCLATYFSIGSRLLSMLGFQQFLDDDEFTTDLVDEGRELIKRGIDKLYIINCTFNAMYIFHKISLQFDIVLISNNIEEINIEIKEKNSVFFSCCRET